MDPYIKEHLCKIKREKPQILIISKNSDIPLIETSILSIGARYISNLLVQEIEESINLCHSVMISLDEIDDEYISFCERVAQMANQLNKPVILNPIGAGITHYKTDLTLKLISNCKFSIIRGSPSEIFAILYPKSNINSTEAEDLVIENARSLSKKFDVAVVTDGKTNSIIDLEKTEYVYIDSILQSKVTGIHSLLTATLAVFHAIEDNRFIAAAAALKFYQTCLREAESNSKGPASFKIEFIDALYINSGLAIN